jgi:hypothetical protein
VSYSPLRGPLKIAALGETGGQDERLAAEAADGESQLPAQLVQVVAAAVRQFYAFEMVPGPLVDDVDAAYMELTARGYTFNEEPYDIPVGRLVTLNDPDGNIVGLEDRSKGGLPVAG